MGLVLQDFSMRWRSRSHPIEIRDSRTILVNAGIPSHVEFDENANLWSYGSSAAIQVLATQEKPEWKTRWTKSSLFVNQSSE
jgi:hypothetical protein